MEKGITIWSSFLAGDSDNKPFYSTFPTDDKGHYPYIVAAYKFVGEDAWRIKPFPAPFEKTLQLLKEHEIQVQTIQEISSGGAVAFPEALQSIHYARAFNRGWNLGYDGSGHWYAPGEDIPMPPSMAEAAEEQISLKLIAIAANWIELQVRQGNKKQHLVFDAYMSDGLPGLVFLLKSLIDHGFGHMSLGDNFEGFFFKLSAWSRPDGSTYMKFKYDSDNARDVQWNGKANTDAVIENLRVFLRNVLNHPNLISEYIYHKWDGHKEFEDELEDATKHFLTSLSKGEENAICGCSIVDENDPPLLLCIDDDEMEENFRLQWLRNNILRLQPAKELYQKYRQMLEEFIIPEGWLGIPDK